ncbi:hypothetical protein BUALT_Bualt04G0039600 [Buddleja alternifolia]|uniref:Uncharacterized protein n=1 Tax=Buddleja alternifolia TaxID=168488 RepID=A0AAV6XXE5_9LAMI|nr:hypothetical protein BUALT_Bualt04G0039600 [Buddleja alternifolia]
MYIKCGGRRPVVDFYYTRPGWSFDIGLRLIKNDMGDMVMCDLVRDFDVETQEFSRGVDGEASRTKIVKEQVAGDTEQMDEHVADEENVVHLGSVQEDAEVVDEMECHNFAQGGHAFLQEEEEKATEPTEMAQSRVSRAVVLGKEQNIPFIVDEEDSRSEFDDSSDEDYLESNESEDDEEGYKDLVDEGAVAAVDTSGAVAIGGTSDEEHLEGEFSDSLSFILDDIEGSSDDDIFLGKIQPKLNC